MKKRIIEPSEIPEKDLPLIVLQDDLRGVVGLSIKRRTKGNYCHVMEMHKQGFYASQNASGFKEVPIKKIAKPYIRLKFWKYTAIKPRERKGWRAKIDMEIRSPWWKRRYDFLGIVGQGLYSIFRLPILKRLNNPWTKFCSERVASHLRDELGLKLPLHPSPADLNRAFEKMDSMEVYGYWFHD